MSQINGFTTESTINSAYPGNSAKYWCFLCEKELSLLNVHSSEVYCPQCGCVCELIETENDPRTFKPYDPETEKQQGATPNNTALVNSSVVNNQTQVNQNVQQQSSIPTNRTVRYQVLGGPVQVIEIQTLVPQRYPDPMIQNAGGTGALNQRNDLFGSLISPFGLMNPILSAFSQNLFADLEGRIIEEFLRNDPNRYGPPPAPQESIAKLKETQFSENSSKAKDCSICQEDYKDGDNLMGMPCEHNFHKNCLIKWLEMHNSCPVCRKGLTAENRTNEEC